MGRTNYEGFHGYWPPVAADPQAAPRDRALASWLDEVEKVVFSRTLEEAPWRNSRVARDVEAETRALKASPDAGFEQALRNALRSMMKGHDR